VRRSDTGSSHLVYLGQLWLRYLGSRTFTGSAACNFVPITAWLTAIS